MTKLRGTNLARMEPHIDEERLRSLRKRYRSGRATRYVIRPLLMAIMLTALLVSMLSVVVEVSGDGRWFGLAILLFFVALEGIYTTNWLNHPRQMPLDRTTYRAAELLLLIVIVRVASWIIFGEGIPNADDLMQYLRAPQVLFLNAPFLISVLLAAIIWRLAILVSQIFNQLQVSDFELRFHSLPLAQRKARIDDQPIQLGRTGLVDALLRFWLLGGLLLIIAVGISTLEQQSMETLMAPLASGRVGLEPRLLSAVLLYFIIGLWLLSEARLMQVHARWLVNSVETDEDSRRKWQRASLFVLLIVIVVAAFLPIGSTSALSQIINVAIFWLLAIVNVIIFLLVLPIAMLLALLSGQSAGDVTPLPPVGPPQMPPPLEAGTSPISETLSMVLSSGFWTVAIVVVVMALIFYLRERRETGRELGSEQKLWDQIVVWLKEIWARFRGQVRSLQSSLIVRSEDASEEDQSPIKRPRWRFLRVSGLSPRDQIRYFYLSTVRRAGERGVKRPSAGTPSEFVHDLKKNWPEVEKDLDELTSAFLKARYSDEAVDDDDLPEVKRTWKEVRRELKQDPDRRRDDEPGGGEEL